MKKNEKMKKLTYSQSGVNIDIANKAKKEIAKSLAVGEKRVLNKVGAYASLYDISNFPEYKEPVLVLKTEEPGSKQLLAFQYGRVELICYDMVNHLINDCIAMGAKPLSIQDAIICGKLEKNIVVRIINAISSACKEQNCVLTGGETSEQPGVLESGTYILTSSIVGIIDKKNIIDGSKIKEGNIIIGLESSGLHTNGYTMIRELIKRYPEAISENIGSRKFLDIILEPHRCYYKNIKDLFLSRKINGIAHITGGGIKENLDRILPSNKDALINLEAYQILPIFDYIKKKGGIEDDEMLRTFNMGIGLVMVIDKNNVQNILKQVRDSGVNCYKIGKIINGNKKVQTNGMIKWL